MSWSCSVRVIDEDGDEVSGARVSLVEGGLIGGHLIEYTDSNGWAEFEIDSTDRSDFIFESINVDGDEVSGSLAIDDGETLSFTI